MQALNFEDSLLLHAITTETEKDPNLSRLPDQFKQEAIRIMFEENKLLRQGSFVEPEDGCPGESINNKRVRVEDNQDEDKFKMEE